MIIIRGYGGLEIIFNNFAYAETIKQMPYPCEYITINITEHITFELFFERNADYSRVHHYLKKARDNSEMTCEIFIDENGFFVDIITSGYKLI